jgi:hypothetical protein
VRQVRTTQQRQCKVSESGGEHGDRAGGVDQAGGVTRTSIPGLYRGLVGEVSVEDRAWSPVGSEHEVSEPRHGRRTWAPVAVRFAALATVLTAAAGLGACGGPNVASAPSTTTSLVYGKGELRNVYCTHTTGQATSCGGLLPPPEGVSDELVLASTVARAGTTIQGDLVVTNTSGSAIDLRDRHGCTPGYAVGLTNAALPAANAPGFAAVCGSAALTLPPGTTRFPIEVITTHFGCTNGPTPSGGSDRFPRCITGGPPPLPSRRYVAVLYGSSLALPPATARVTLTG